MNQIDCTKCKFYDKHCGGKCGYINCECIDCIHRGNNPACNIGNSQIPTNHFILGDELDNGNGLPTRIY